MPGTYAPFELHARGYAPGNPAIASSTPSDSTALSLLGVGHEVGKRPLQSILCGTQAGQEDGLREHFDIRRAASGFDVGHIEEAPPELGFVAPELDPPAGERAGWIDDVTGRHGFTVVLSREVRVLYRWRCRTRLVGQSLVDLRAAAPREWLVPANPGLRPPRW